MRKEATDKMKIFQNKFFLICLCVAIVLCAVPTTFSIMGYQSLSRNIVGVVTSPFRWVATVVTDAFEGFSLYFSGIDRFYEENEALREENAALQEKLDRAELLEKENERLRDYLGMKQEHPDFTMEEARVISREAGNYVTVFTLNKGTLHGIRANMPVIVREGLVGYVSEVGLNWCKVCTVIETATSVGAYVPRSGATGIVSGDYSMKMEGVCKFSYVEGNADIQVGDKLYSSGIGSIYPADLLIGEIIEVGEDAYNRTVVATVQPVVDFSAIEWAVILTGYEQE